MASNAGRTDGVVPIIACSTGAVTRWPDATDAERLERWCPMIDAGAFEVMIYDAWYGDIENIARRWQALQLAATAVHAEKSTGPGLAAEDATVRDSSLASFARNCRFARHIGAGAVVLHLWGLPDGDARLDRQLAMLLRLIDIAEAEGVQLGIEAIPCTVGTPMTNLERVLEADPRARFVLDTEFLAMHGELDAALEAGWLWNGHRVIHLHIKDFDGELVDDRGRRRYLHPGEGRIPFGRWLQEVANRGYSGPIALEAPVVDSAGSVSLPRLNASLCQLRTLVQDAWASAPARPGSGSHTGGS